MMIMALILSFRMSSQLAVVFVVAAPVLALLLAGPSLSLPNMLVIRGVLGTQKTVVYVAIVIVLSTVAGLIFGSM